MANSLGSYRPEQLVLKITLLGSNPKIWRRVEVQSGLTLHDLHYVIQCVFEWNDEHLYHFLVPPGGKLTYKAMREAARYHVLPPDPYFGDEREAGRADKQLIGRVFTPDCKQMIYEYDFGDSWEHVVKLEKRIPGGDENHVPVCLAGENAAPLDDMGGIGGFYRWIEALLDETDEIHEQAVEWLGEDFNETKFDVQIANEQLSRVFTPAPKRARKPRKKRE